MAERHVNVEPFCVATHPGGTNLALAFDGEASGPQNNLRFDALESARRPTDTACCDDPPYVVAERHIRFVCDPRPRRFSQATERNMNPLRASSSVNRRALLSMLALLPALWLTTVTAQQAPSA